MLRSALEKAMFWLGAYAAVKSVTPPLLPDHRNSVPARPVSDPVHRIRPALTPRAARPQRPSRRHHGRREGGENRARLERCAVPVRPTASRSAGTSSGSTLPEFSSGKQVPIQIRLRPSAVLYSMPAYRNCSLGHLPA